MVFDGSGRVLLQMRSMGKDRFPGRWDSSVSGHVDSGEGYDQCIVREAMEEIGIRLESTPERLFKIDACEETDQEFTWVYRTYSEGPFTPNEEGDPPGENRSRERVPFLRPCLEQAPQGALTSQLYAAFVVLITTAPIL